MPKPVLDDLVHLMIHFKLVCVCGVAEYPATINLFRCSRGTAWSVAVTDHRNGFWTQNPRTCSDEKCPFGPSPESLLLPCFPVKVATGKPSALRAETYCTRDSSVVLETHQLYSRLISCTRKIRTLHLESKCEHPILGGPSGVPIV